MHVGARRLFLAFQLLFCFVGFPALCDGFSYFFLLPVFFVLFSFLVAFCPSAAFFASLYSISPAPLILFFSFAFRQAASNPLVPPRQDLFPDFSPSLFAFSGFRQCSRSLPPCLLTQLVSTFSGRRRETQPRNFREIIHRSAFSLSPSRDIHASHLFPSPPVALFLLAPVRPISSLSTFHSSLGSFVS